MVAMYTALLIVHSWLRWVVLVAGLIAVVRAFGGWSSGRSWTASDNRLGAIFTGIVDLQLLIGLVLYVWLSPFTREAFGDFGAAMRNPTLRFWAVEHAVGMLLAVALLHIGRVRIRKADAASRHRIAAIFFALALVLILFSIPWPGMPAGRTLFRLS
jgi:hypothetical protein